MRAKRPLRESGPCFALVGLMDHAAPEVQVQQQNAQELNKFFIDVDDSTVSPMITTDPSFHTDDRNGESIRRVSVERAEVELNTRGNRVKENGGKPGSDGTAAGGPCSSTSPGATEAKFIHVNNTNIFVLIDGISMFVEGKSTFTGTEDARLLTERLRQKKLARSVDTVQEAILNIEMSPDGFVREGVPIAPEAAAKLPTLTPATYQHSSAMPAPPVHPLIENSGSVGCPRLFRTPSSRMEGSWESLFAHATKPVGSPLFRSFRATDLIERCRGIGDASNALGSSGHLNGCAGRATTTLSCGVGASPLEGLASPTGNGCSSPCLNGMGRFPNSMSTPSLLHFDSSSSLVSLASGAGHPLPGHGHRGGAARRPKPISVEEIGHSNRSLDMEEVVVEEMIGKGTQGTVFRVRLDGKVYALKCMNIDEAMNATNVVERQGRKKGLVKELTMITLQRSRPPPSYLMLMFNAVASLDAEPKQLSILMELMSSTVENIQQMISRIPTEELMRITQSTFRKYISGDSSAKQAMKELCKQQHLYGSTRHALGRNTYNEPAVWERNATPETPMPEVLLSMLASDVLMGLEELHRDYSIIHCDVKPANVLLCYDQQKFKLADFGCGCVMEDREHVERRGIDLGSMLYKAPERFAANMPNRLPEIGAGDGSEPEEAVVEFTSKADVWSLGIMLLELAAGVHPCDHFKSDFWNYGNLLKLSKMRKPLSWSEPFYDFILRSVCVDVERRWSVQQLLKHPFVLKFQHVPREKLKQFVQRLEVDSRTFHKRQQSALLKEQILLSTTRRHKDTYQLQSKKKWATYTAYLKRGPPTEDQAMFPELRYIGS